MNVSTTKSKREKVRLLFFGTDFGSISVNGGISKMSQNLTSVYEGGRNSTEVAFVLLNQLPRVRISILPKFFCCLLSKAHQGAKVLLRNCVRFESTAVKLLPRNRVVSGFNSHPALGFFKFLTSLYGIHKTHPSQGCNSGVLKCKEKILCT